MLLQLVPAASVQGDLWSKADATDRTHAMDAVDNVTAKYGCWTLHFATSGVPCRWNLLFIWGNANGNART